VDVGALGEELGRLRHLEERHRRLGARLALVVIASLIIDLVGAGAMYVIERHAHGSQITTVGQALFFSTVQLLTVSSQMPNPVTPLGRVVDIGLQVWAVIVVAGSAGAVATFFQSGDSS
jgi:hypothetical protein